MENKKQAQQGPSTLPTASKPEDLTPDVVKAHEISRDSELVRDLWKYNPNHEELPKDETDGEEYEYISIFDMDRNTKNRALRKKFMLAMKIHGPRWNARIQRLKAQRNCYIRMSKAKPLDRENIMKIFIAIINNSENFVDEIKEMFRRNNSKVIMLDISNKLDSENFEGGMIVKCLVLATSILCETRIDAMASNLIPRMDFISIMKKYRNTLNMFPNTHSAVKVPRQAEFMQCVRISEEFNLHNMRRLTVSFSRAAAAMFRVRYHHLDSLNKIGISTSNNDFYGLALRLTLIQLVRKKLENNAKRPFFSMKRLDFISREFQIDTYSNPNRVCGCCRKYFKETVLYHCSGCRRCWYCSEECQKKAWKEHKQYCGTKWRNETIVIPNELKHIVKIRKGGTFLKYRWNNKIHVLVVVLNQKTKEMFDALSDRTVFIERNLAATDE